ncbi:hypothetical protein IHE45_20G048200 [Dioscorea alata]|uniref:Uncharacterized protein n=1 Tax=Dioscorea alata TaxID=55571 RepID=A0ACB7TU20_DIOAL|nr:hypothetical protein IHE45_20G048200 [Dioscorea alata]
MSNNMITTTAAAMEASGAASSTQVLKRKRNLPGNPDAEVIALSPKTLMATNRFVCEICNKGFQRDQNLQLHRRGHNLPWKLKQRPTNKEVKKKVYICPEVSCIHHDPSRALGDLTGIKKHYSRKHGEKKWKCDKCSKKYAVQSDWKAHTKICGTREYRCDCGTLFSRRDSFITHRAFCDALAEESARSIPSSSTTTAAATHTTTSASASAANACQQVGFGNQVEYFHEYSYENNKHLGKAAGSGHLSATALLQKAAEMGAGSGRTQESTLMAGHTSCSGLSAAGFDGSFEGVFGERRRHHGLLGGGGGSGGDHERGSMTRDFLGLRAPISHRDIFSFAAGFDPSCINSNSSTSSSYHEQPQ